MASSNGNAYNAQAKLEVLEDQFVMSAAGQHQRADEYKDPCQIPSPEGEGLWVD